MKFPDNMDWYRDKNALWYVSYTKWQMFRAFICEIKKKMNLQKLKLQLLLLVIWEKNGDKEAKEGWLLSLKLNVDTSMKS